MRITIISILLFCLQGCNSTNYDKYNRRNDVFHANDQDTVITIERSFCFGFCPAYRLVIYGNGFFIYEGIANVKVIEEKTGYLEKSNVDSIINLMLKKNYFELPNGDDIIKNCKLHSSDSPTVTTSLRIGYRFKLIKLYHGGCSDADSSVKYINFNTVLEIESAIDKYSNVQKYIGNQEN